MRWASLRLEWTLLLTLASCVLPRLEADDSPDAASSSGLLPEEAFVRVMTEATCANVSDSCCSDEGYAHDIPACRRNRTFLFQGMVDRAAATVGAKYNSDAAQQCAELHRQIAMTCSADDATLLAQSTACGTVWSGTKKLSEECSSDADCAVAADGSPTQCNANLYGSGRRVCVPARLPHLVVDSQCDTTEPEPEVGAISSPIGTCFKSDGLYCADDGSCKPAIPRGGECWLETFYSYDPCEQGTSCLDDICTEDPGEGESCSLLCRPPFFCSVGTCVPPGELGDPCVLPSECASGKCAANHLCVATTSAAKELCQYQ